MASSGTRVVFYLSDPSGSSVVSASQIAKDGPNLLLFRSSAPRTVPYSRSLGPAKWGVHGLKVEATHGQSSPKFVDCGILAWRSSQHAQEFSTYAFDPETGAPPREYPLPAKLGWGAACTDGAGFRFLRTKEKTHTLELVELAPAAKPN